MTDSQQGTPPQDDAQESAADQATSQPVETPPEAESSATENAAHQEPAQTVETKTVERAEADYLGKPPADPSSLSTENAPAFQEPEKPAEAAQSNEPIVIPPDPDGSVMVGVVRDALRERVVVVRSDSMFKRLQSVSKDDATTRAVSVLLTRILQHPNARAVTETTLGDVLQGDEPEHFAARGLPGPELLEVLQELCPCAIGLLADRLAAAAAV